MTEVSSPLEPAAPPPQVPGTVRAASILMYVGGGYTALTGIAGAASGAVVHSALLAAYGALFAGLGFAVSKRRRWARNVVLVLCGIGAALGLVTIIGGSPTTGLGRLAWPLVYAILLLSSSARVWFAARPVPEA